MLAALIAAIVLALPHARPGHCFLDTAHAVSDFQAQILDGACRKVDRSGAGQIAIVIVNDLQGLSRPEYAVELFKQWGVGHKGRDDGLLVLLALPPADRGIKVEVGYGLEGRLNDGKVMAAVREKALPYLKQGKYAEGLLALVGYFDGEMQKEYIDQLKAQRGIVTSAAPSGRLSEVPADTMDPVTIGVIGIAIIFAVIGGIVFALYLARKNEENRRRALEDAERVKDLVPRAERLLKTRDDIPRDDRAKLQFFVDEAKPIVESAPPAPARRVRHSDPEPSYSPPSYSSPTYDPSSTPDFGGFGGGSSGGGGGDVGF